MSVAVMALKWLVFMPLIAFCAYSAMVNHQRGRLVLAALFVALAATNLDTLMRLGGA